ncbi:hypothetical protein AHAS_Ahas05G0006400 [Arachis hypogaea]
MVTVSKHCSSFHKWWFMVLPPNDVTFIGLLSACSHERMMSVGVMLFKTIAMKMCGCWWVVNVVVCWGRESVGRREVVMAMVRGKRRGMW